MLLKRGPDLKYSDVTPRDVYLNRRKFLYGMGLAGGLALAGKSVANLAFPSARAYAATSLPGLVKGPFSTDEKVTPEQAVATYNNYYEFGTDKGDPAKNAQKFVTSPWSVSVEGEVAKPRKFTMEEILKLAPLEERIYRHRCVEAWSIVVPWVGFSFSTLVKLVEPNSNARYVAFETYFDKKQMPLWGRAGIQLPYVEGLRLDESMPPLGVVCVGMYRETPPNQERPPVGKGNSWKYGIKSIKALVK